jgi:centrin-1
LNDAIGSIGVDELVEPLISLGIADSIEEVKKIIDSVDDDGSGKIEFTEFLKIIGSADAGNGGSAGIVQFFKSRLSEFLLIE